MLRSGIGYRVVAKKTRSPTLWACRFTQFSRMMRTARPLIIHALDTHTSRLSPEGISWNYDGPLLLLRNIGRNSTSTSDPNSRSHRIRLSISPRANSRHTLRQAHTPAIHQLFHYPAHLTFSVESHAPTTGQTPAPSSRLQTQNPRGSEICK